MNRSTTRDLQRYCAATFMQEIAADQSARNRRLCLIETHMAAQQQHLRDVKRSNESSNSAKLIGENSKNATQETSYWFETATTLSKENTELIDRITRCEEKCAKLNTSVSRLSHRRIVLEKELANANRELLRMTVCRYDGFTPCSIVPSKTKSIPVNTEGKDAIHWYQACRTLEAHHIQKTSELEAKIESLLKSMTELDTKRRKRRDIDTDTVSMPHIEKP